MCTHEMSISRFEGMIHGLTNLTGGRLPGTETQLAVGSGSVTDFGSSKDETGTKHTGSEHRC